MTTMDPTEASLPKAQSLSARRLLSISASVTTKFGTFQKSSSGRQLQTHRSAEEPQSASSVSSGNTPSRFNMFRRSASSTTSNSTSGMQTLNHANKQDPNSYDFQNEQFLMTMDGGLDFKSSDAGQEEDECYFEWNNSKNTADDKDEDSEHTEDEEPAEPVSAPVRMPSVTNAIATNNTKGSSKLYRSFSRIVRGGSKESNDDESKTPDSPRIHRDWTGSPASLTSSPKPSGSPLVLSNRRSFWASSDQEAISPLVSTRSMRKSYKSQQSQQQQPQVTSNNRELMILEEMNRLEDCIKDTILRQSLLDSLMNSAKEEVQLKVQFLSAVHETDFVIESEVRNEKLRKLVKKFLGKGSTFRLQGVPELYKEKLLDNPDYDYLPPLRTLLMEQLVQEEHVLRAVHELLRNKPQTSAEGDDEEYVMEYQV